MSVTEFLTATGILCYLHKLPLNKSALHQPVEGSPTRCSAKVCIHHVSRARLLVSGLALTAEMVVQLVTHWRTNEFVREMTRNWELFDLGCAIHVEPSVLLTPRISKHSKPPVPTSLSRTNSNMGVDSLALDFPRASKDGALEAEGLAPQSFQIPGRAEELG